MFLIYFLSFAQLEEKMNKQKKKDCYHGFAEAFIFYQMIIIVIITLSVQDSPPPHLLLQIVLQTLQRNMSGRKRKEG